MKFRLSSELMFATIEASSAAPFDNGSVLLVADFAWDSPGGGAQIVRSLICDRLGSQYFWATPSKLVSDLRLGEIGLRSGSLGRAGRHSPTCDAIQYARPLAEEIMAAARDCRASALWAVLHGSMVHIVRHLAKKLPIPLHVSVHDDPPFGVALRSRRYVPFVPIIARDFGYALRRADTIDVISQAMADRYQKTYGVRCFVLHRALRAGVERVPSVDRRNGIVVGVLGNTYQYSELKALARATLLTTIRLGVSGKLLFIGGNRDALQLSNWLNRSLPVEATGYLCEPLSIERLKQCFALYLNYPFNSRSRVFRQTSFPTKLSTYVYAARPILLHAPMDSSISELAEYPQYVTPWMTLSPSDGCNALSAMFNSPDTENSFHQQADAIRQRYFDSGTHVQTLNAIFSDSRHSAARLTACSSSQYKESSPDLNER
jgi:hypothetical protein